MGHIRVANYSINVQVTKPLKPIEANSLLLFHRCEKKNNVIFFHSYKKAIIMVCGLCERVCRDRLLAYRCFPNQFAITATTPGQPVDCRMGMREWERNQEQCSYVYMASVLTIQGLQPHSCTCIAPPNICIAMK